MIGTTLAEKLGARTGDPIRVRSADRESVLRIAGIFDVGSEMVNGRWVVTLAPQRSDASWTNR